MKENIYLLVLTLFLFGEQVSGQTEAGITSVGRYDPVFDRPPKNVPTPKTPDAPLAGNGDIGVVQGGTPDALTFYLGKNDCWRAYPVYPGGGIALPGGLTLLMPDLGSAIIRWSSSAPPTALPGPGCGCGQKRVTLPSMLRVIPAVFIG